MCAIQLRTKAKLNIKCVVTSILFILSLIEILEADKLILLFNTEQKFSCENDIQYNEINFKNHNVKFFEKKSNSKIKNNNNNFVFRKSAGKCSEFKTRRGILKNPDI